MLEKIQRAPALRAMIVVSPILCSPALMAAESSSSGGNPTIEAKTSAMRHMPGFLPLHWDAKAGKLYLEIRELNTDMLYFDSLPFGTGSDDLGLDRGQVSRAKLVRTSGVGGASGSAKSEICQAIIEFLDTRAGVTLNNAQIATKEMRLAVPASTTAAE